MLRLLPALLLLRFLSLPCTSSAASYSNYSEAAAIRYVDLAGQAYCTPSQIRNATNQHAALISGFTPASVWHNDNLQFYAGYDALTDSVFVAVRGSLDLNNWIDNIDAVKTAPYEGAGDVEVHSGFWSEYEQLRDPIVAAVTEAADKYGTDRLSVAGHSSGGANSVFLAYDVARGALLPGFELLPLYTFGCPRVGNKAFYDAFEALDIEHTRVVHWRDIVPHLPNEWMGFRHTAREVWYSNEDSTEFTVCSDEDGEDPSCSNSLTFAMSGGDHCYYVGKPICACDAEEAERLKEELDGEDGEGRIAVQ